MPDGYDRGNGAPLWCAFCHDGGSCWLPHVIATSPPAQLVLGCPADQLDPDWNGRCAHQSQPDWVACEPESSLEA
jgi:hypothetical protein